MDLGTVWPYVLTLATFFVIYNILTWGLNIQFGYAGIPNFAYISFMAIGAYVAGVIDLAPTSQPLYVQYILGLHLPWPISLIGGGLVAGLVGLLVGLLVLSRLRSDYLAIVTFSLGFLLYDVVTNFQPLFNGFQGLSGISLPLNDHLNLDYNTYQLFFLGLAFVIMVLLWVVANRIYRSPLGRTMRAIREDVNMAEALGKNTFRFRLMALTIGCVYAGIGGALTIEYLGSFNPSAFTAPETFIIWTALLIGGRANNWGVILGSLIVPIGLFEVTRNLPLPPDQAVLFENFRFMAIGLALMLILWFRPQGILPERRRRYYEIPASSTAAPHA